MKKNVMISALLITVMLFAGCGKKTEQIEAKWTIKEGSEWTSYKNYFLMNGLMTESELGYYYQVDAPVGGGYNIMFFDKQSQKSTRLCNQANCKHKDENCTSYLDDHCASSMQYYGGYLYYVKRDENMDSYLYRMSALGTDREEVMQLCTFDEGADCGIWLNNGYMIYNVLSNTADEMKIYTINMQTNEKTCLPNIAGNHIMDIKFYKETMIIGMSSRTDEAYYQYDLKKQEMKTLARDCQSNSFTVDGAKLYYADGQVMKCYNLDNEAYEEDLLTYEGYSYSSYDSHYIYVYNSSKDSVAYANWIKVFDKNKELVETILFDQNAKKCVPLIFGGEDFLFYCNDVAGVYYYYDKSQIGTGNGVWKKVVRI